MKSITCGSRLLGHGGDFEASTFQDPTYRVRGLTVVGIAGLKSTLALLMAVILLISLLIARLARPLILELPIELCENQECDSAHPFHLQSVRGPSSSPQVHMFSGVWCLWVF